MVVILALLTAPISIAVAGSVALSNRSDAGGIGGPLTLVATPDGRTVAERDFGGK